MQTKDIQVGTDYYVANHKYQVDSRYRYPIDATNHRARVLAVRQPREVVDRSFSWSRYTTTKNDGVQVEFLDRDGDPTGRTAILASRYVVETWEEFTRAHEAAQDSKRAIANAEKERAERVRAAMVKTLGERVLETERTPTSNPIPSGFRYELSWYKGKYQARGTIALDDVATLLEMAYENGRQAGITAGLGVETTQG